MATQSVNSNKREFSKPHLTTSPMLIDVQGRVAKIYERRDVTEWQKDLEFVASAFSFCCVLCGGVATIVILVVSLVQNIQEI